MNNHGLLFILNMKMNCSSSLDIDDTDIKRLSSALSDSCDEVREFDDIYCFVFKEYHINVFLVKSIAKKYFNVLKKAYL